MIDPDLKASRDTPTLVANRFYVTHGDAHTRIAFGEGFEDGVRYHTAVQLENADADALAELIERLHAQRSKPPAHNGD